MIVMIVVDECYLMFILGHKIFVSTFGFAIRVLVFMQETTTTTNAQYT